MPERTAGNAASMVPQRSSTHSDKEIRCAEIKTIPTMKTADHPPKTFKIGEYNRATASFEIPSVACTPVAELEANMAAPRREFDLDADIMPGTYFKSSFARSMASSQSKSLDYSTAKSDVNLGASIGARNGADSNGNSTGEGGSQTPSSNTASWHLPGKENWDLRRAEMCDATDDEILAIGLDEKLSTKRHTTQNGSERCRSRSSSNGFHRPSSEYLDDNGSASCRSSQQRSYSSASSMTAVMLQSQVTTLQWQLRQAEAARQMHRAVLEQVVTFLQRTHNSLNLMLSSPADSSTLTRVPRSRSVHSVETASVSSHSTMPRSDSTASFYKAKSSISMTDPNNCPKHGEAFRELSWRRQRRQQAEEEQALPGKLSEDAFRLMRTVQSLLNTREPDLAAPLHSVGSSPITTNADVSSASSTASAALDSDANSSDHFQSQDTVVHVGARPELQAAFGNCSPIPGLPAANLKDATMSLGRRRRRRTVDVFGGNGSPPNLSTSSADDESGFSSLNSFHDAGVPAQSARNGHCQEVGIKHMRSQCDVIHEERREAFTDVGLPLNRTEENCKIHRRWSSTPADNLKAKGNAAPGVVRVLWV